MPFENCSKFTCVSGSSHPLYFVPRQLKPKLRLISPWGMKKNPTATTCVQCLKACLVVHCVEEKKLYEKSREINVFDINSDMYSAVHLVMPLFKICQIATL